MLFLPDWCQGKNLVWSCHTKRDPPVWLSKIVSQTTFGCQEMPSPFLPKVATPAQACMSQMHGLVTDSRLCSQWVTASRRWGRPVSEISDSNKCVRMMLWWLESTMHVLCSWCSHDNDADVRLLWFLAENLHQWFNQLQDCSWGTSK